MALTRKMLKAMGIEEEKIDEIIDAHTETVNALKEQAKANSNAAERLEAVQKELDELKVKSDGGYKDKYEKEHTAYEQYRQQVADKEKRLTAERLFRAELTGVGITGKRADAIIRATDLSSIKVKDGALEDAKAVQDGIRADWAEFIPQTETKGAPVDNPPANTGAKMTRDQIMAITDRAERRAAIAANMELFTAKGD